MVKPKDEVWYMKHASYLGQVVGSLLTLETLARIAVALRETKGDLRKVKPFLRIIKQNEWVELSPLSNEEDMTWALESYNSTVKKTRPDLMIDKKQIVALRDAIAHGRAFAINDPGVQHLCLLKFGRKPQKGTALVELRADMTEDWFNEKLKLLEQASDKVSEAISFEKRELS